MPDDEKAYEEKVLAAFKTVSEKNGDGASAFEVYEQMVEDNTISPLDTVIDIADIMSELSAKGRIGSRPR